MSLTGALSSAISALNAQSQSLAMISDNISNADTTGYKTTSAMFNDLVTASNSATAYTSGGVTVNGRANITQQGLLAATTNATDVAIQGSGFFVTTNATTGGTTSYTRNGAFTTDNSGYLVNNGNYLEGWRTDAQGNIIGNASAASLGPINTQVASTSGSATTKTTIAANLPADAAVGATFNSSMTVYDSLGTASTIQIDWKKTADNAWTASFEQPKLASAPTTASANPITDTGHYLQCRWLAQFDGAEPADHLGDWLDGRRGRQLDRQWHGDHAQSRHGRQDRRPDAILVGRNHTRRRSHRHHVGRPALRQAEQHLDRQGRRGRRDLLQWADHRDLQDRGRDLQRSQRIERGQRRHVLVDGSFRQRHAADLGNQRRGHDLRQRAGVQHHRHQRPVLQHDLGAASLFGGVAGDHHRRQDVRHADLGGVAMMSAETNDRLLIRLRRLKAKADSVQPHDRKQLCALLDDIETLRDLLMRECARVDQELNRAKVRVTAITAYGRSAQSVRAMRRGH